MELDDRKVKILKTIIKSYMETGEPIGSRTISKILDLKLSSATIRNEMSDLEEMGYIIQPHTSSGRIPSDKGYRFYVDEILKDKITEVSEFKSDVLERVDKIENVLTRLAKMIAANTNYATMISGPKYHKNKIKFIQLSNIDTNKLLLVTVVEGNIIKNSILNISPSLNEKELLNLNLIINTNLAGLAIEEINIPVINRLKEEAGVLRDIAELILERLAKDFDSADENLQIYTSGATNFFKYPELAAGDKASELIGAFEEKEKLKEILVDGLDNNLEDKGTGIQVYIGEELPVQDLKDCSLVTANYEFGAGIRGTIGIVGPKRMDYEKVLRTIRTVMDQLEEKLKE